MQDAKDKIKKVYGWKSVSVEKELDRLECEIRADERMRFARFMYQILLDHKHLTVREVLDRIKRDELGRTTLNIKHQTHSQKEA